MKTDEELLKMVRQVVYQINQVPEEHRKDLVYTIELELKAIKISEEERIDGLVYLTKDLTQFKDILGNRVINPHSVFIKKLADSIKETGNIVPVVKNENDELIDGQRRILAVRQYGLSVPIKYIRHIRADIDTVSEVNQYQVKWNYKDWLHKYTATENQEYVDYEKIAAKYEHYMRSRSLRGLLMNNRVDALKLEIWEGGEFTIDRYNLPDNIKFLDLLVSVFKIGEGNNIFAKDRDFQKALFEVFKNTKKLDTERLLYKIKFGFNKLNIRTDYKTYRKILGELYNVRLPGDKHHVITDEEKKQGESENENHPQLAL